MASTFYKAPASGSRATSSGRGKASPADRGKDAEGLVASRLEILARQADNAFERLPDARAGSNAAALADFLYSYRGKVFLLEVKEVEHDFRLPHGNFKKDQVARMRRFVMAGMVGRVLVHHKSAACWRLVDVEDFREREGGSWDLSYIQGESLAEIAQRHFQLASETS